MGIKATPLTAALAGLFAGVAMPRIWPHLGDDTLDWIVAFLLVIALPAHAFVVGFGQRPATATGAVDTALLKRVAIWLACAIIPVAVVQVLPL
jgi:hypothetical protein